MNHIKKIIALLVSCMLSIGSFAFSMKQDALYNGIAGSLFAAAVGDGLGGFTEFNPAVQNGDPLTSSVDAVNVMLQRGLICTSNDIQHDVYGQRFAWLRQNGLINQAHGVAIAYTDDTGMSLLVTQVLIQARNGNWDLRTTMAEIARLFTVDMNKSTGWTAPGRAPGNACIQGVQLLSNRLKNKQVKGNWWRVGGNQAGGCGSVMRAHPFGLLFADDLIKAETWSVEHSRLTHQDPIALASCAAMAVGTALALRQENPEVVIAQMIAAAQKYDHNDHRTVIKMQRAQAYAQQARALMNRKNLNTVYDAFDDEDFIALHTRVFHEFKGWSAHDALAAAVYIFALVPNDPDAAICLGVHTPGDSDSIASLAGALVGARAGIERLNAQNRNDIEGRTRLELFAQEIVELPKYNPFTQPRVQHVVVPDIEVPDILGHDHNVPLQGGPAQAGVQNKLSKGSIQTYFGLLCVGIVGYMVYKLWSKDKKSDEEELEEQE